MQIAYVEAGELQASASMPHQLSRWAQTPIATSLLCWFLTCFTRVLFIGGCKPTFNGGCGNKLGGGILCLIASADWIHAWPNLKLIPPQQFHWFFPRKFELSSWPGSPLRNWHLHARLHAIKGLLLLAGAAMAPNSFKRGHGPTSNYTDVFCTEKGNYSSFYTTKLNGGQQNIQVRFSG